MFAVTFAAQVPGRDLHSTPPRYAPTAQDARDAAIEAVHQAIDDLTDPVMRLAAREELIRQGPLFTESLGALGSAGAQGTLNVRAEGGQWQAHVAPVPGDYGHAELRRAYRRVHRSTGLTVTVTITPDPDDALTPAVTMSAEDAHGHPVHEQDAETLIGAGAADLARAYALTAPVTTLDAEFLHVHP